MQALRMRRRLGRLVASVLSAGVCGEDDRRRR